MPDFPGQTQVDAAEAYERLFVPSLFRQFAPIVVDAAEVGLGQHVLDIGCGTGILARETLSLVGPKGSVSGVDVDRGMLGVARLVSAGWNRACRRGDRAHRVGSRAGALGVGHPGRQRGLRRAAHIVNGTRE